VLALLAYKCTKCLKRLLIGFLSPANQESSLILISTNDLLFILYILLCNVSGVAHLGSVVNMLYANIATEECLHNSGFMHIHLYAISLCQTINKNCS
jgi:hypothetical protein